ncbi:MAG TPA: iron chelate uptake ABC transporter family permease subunit, partial [Castellaniella sp.]|nr:iron chelate uptake ABC transporter family permease subunit [Castellaniella sp.]
MSTRFRQASGKLAPQPVLVMLLAALALAALTASASGALTIPWASFPRLLWGSVEPGEQLLRNVLFGIRLPRVLLGIVAGAALAVAGVVMQALFRNPLAEP